MRSLKSVSSAADRIDFAARIGLGPWFAPATWRSGEKKAIRASGALRFENVLHFTIHDLKSCGRRKNQQENAFHPWRAVVRNARIGRTADGGNVVTSSGLDTDARLDESRTDARSSYSETCGNDCTEDDSDEAEGSAAL
jgi:hypothetical protein